MDSVNASDLRVCDFCGTLVDVDPLSPIYRKVVGDNPDVKIIRTNYYQVKVRYAESDSSVKVISKCACHNCIGRAMNAFIQEHKMASKLLVETMVGTFPKDPKVRTDLTTEYVHACHIDENKYIYQNKTKKFRSIKTKKG